MGHDLAGNMNLPDAWRNTDWMYQITDVFTWTHATQRTGTVLGVANTPRIVDDGRWPGRVMYTLATQKVGWPASDIEAAKNTARGFVGHNAMDTVVHFGYFLGGTLPLWATHHRDKETWADYVLWLTKGSGTFHSDGRSARFWDIADVQNSTAWPVVIPLSCHAGIARLAQGVARKLRRNMDFDPGTGAESGRYSTVEDVQAIDARVAAFRGEMSQAVRSMTHDEYDEMVVLANAQGWTVTELEGMFNASRSRAQAWISSYCN
jgi:hypothetical protein